MDAVKEEMIKQEERGETPDYIKAAEKVAQRLEEANKRTEELIKKQEELRARDIIGGKSEIAKPEPKKEIDPKEYAQKALRGEILK